MINILKWIMMLEAVITIIIGCGLILMPIKFIGLIFDSIFQDESNHVWYLCILIGILNIHFGSVFLIVLLDNNINTIRKCIICLLPLDIVYIIMIHNYLIDYGISVKMILNYFVVSGLFITRIIMYKVR